MSSMKKNVLAVALVAGLGLAGGAAAYNYGTSGNNPANGPGATDSETALPDAENVAYQNLSSVNNYAYTMTEGLVWNVDSGDAYTNVTTGFTARITLEGGTDDAMWDPLWVPAPADIVLQASMTANGCWTATFDSITPDGKTAIFNINPQGNAVTCTGITSPSPGTLLTVNNARLVNLDNLASGSDPSVNATFRLLSGNVDPTYNLETVQDQLILERVSGVTACADSTGSDVDKYIDVADNWDEKQIPKTRFSADGKLGTAADTITPLYLSGRGNAWQVIDLGDVTLNNTGAGNFAFLGTDTFTTTISGAGDWDAFDHTSSVNDDIYLVNGTCTSGTPVVMTNGGTGGTVSGSNVTFIYTAAAVVTAGVSGFLNTTTSTTTTRLTVCAFQDTDIVIDDRDNHVSTSFFRSNNVTATPAFNDKHPDNVCDLLPLRYNGSTMEVFYINPGGNPNQESFIRLTNRSAPRGPNDDPADERNGGWVRLEGIDDKGVKAPSQASVWVPAGGSVQVKASELQDGSTKVIGGWGAPTGGKWRAVVTAEFPGLVVASFVRNSGGEVLTDVTDTDTRGEQYSRDWQEGNAANTVDERPSDYYQETTPDFHGDGESDGPLGGPDGGTAPSGGSTDPNVPNALGNPGR